MKVIILSESATLPQKKKNHQYFKTYKEPRQNLYTSCCTLADKPISGTSTYTGWCEQDKIPNPKVFQHRPWNFILFTFHSNNSISMHFECTYHRTEFSVPPWPIGFRLSQLHLLLLSISPVCIRAALNWHCLQVKEHAFFPFPQQSGKCFLAELPSSPEGLIFLELRTSHFSGWGIPLWAGKSGRLDKF